MTKTQDQLDALRELHGDDLERVRRELQELREAHETARGSVADLLQHLRTRMTAAREALHRGEADEADRILADEIAALAKSFLAAGGSIN